MFRKLVVSMLSISSILLFNSGANALGPPDNSSTSSTLHIELDLDDPIRAEMKHVDDIGLVIMWNGTDGETALDCRWVSNLNYGKASRDLNGYLAEGDNYIIFVLYNRVYKHKFFRGGKWSYKFRLAHGRKTLWKNSDFKKENDAGVKYWKILKATVDSSGGLSLTDQIDSDVLVKLSGEMKKLGSKLDRAAGIARPFAD